MENNDIWEALEIVKDPEIPVISIVDLGIVREINVTNEGIEVVITPTYSGCPAMKMIETEIINTLKEKRHKNISITTVLSPAWTTDWMNEVAKEKLRAYGIAPPDKTTSDKSVLFFGGSKEVDCPYCKGKNTRLQSQFGSTACKALYYCNDCEEPFDHFKCI